MYHGPMIDPGGNSTAVVSEAIGALTAKQREALAAYVFDRQTQREIGEDQAVPRSTVQKRLRIARERLEAHGVKVRMPGKGRRPAHVARVNPRAIDRLEVDDESIGYTTGRTSDGYQPTAWSDSRSPSSKTYEGQERFE